MADIVQGIEDWFIRFFSTEGVSYDLSVEFVGRLLFWVFAPASIASCY